MTVQNIKIKPVGCQKTLATQTQTTTNELNMLIDSTN